MLFLWLKLDGGIESMVISVARQLRKHQL